MDYREVFEWKVVHGGNGRTPNIRSSGASWNYNNALWVVCGAGAGLGKSSEVWKYDLTAHIWSRVDVIGDAPPSRDGHSGTYIGNGRFVIFGGQGFAEKNNKLGKEADTLRTQTHCKRDVMNDLWVFDCINSKWIPIYPDGLAFPMGRRGHTAIFVPGQDFVPEVNVDAMSYSGSVALTTSTQHTAVAQLSQHSLAPRAQVPVATNASPGRSSTRDGLPAIGQDRIPENSLVVFGGAGIELSKYSEVLYSELWSFSFAKNSWMRHQTRGMDPPPLSDHRAEKVGDYMLVVGGLTPHSLESGLGPHDILSLHLPSSTWATVGISDTTAGPLSLGLHGFSLVSDAHSDRLLVFGGGEVVDCRTAATTKSPTRRADHPHAPTYAISVKDRLLSPIYAEGPAPEPRYSHMTFPGVPVDAPQDSRPSSPLDARFALMRQEETSPSRTLLYVFGGVNQEGGGYCDPVLYALMATSVATPSHHHRRATGHGHTALHGEPSATSFSSAGFDDFGHSEELGRGSIWDSLQTRAQTGSNRAAPRAPSSWAEIKLSLSASRSQRVFDFQPIDTKRSPTKSPVRSLAASPATVRSPGRQASPLRLLSIQEFGVRAANTTSRGSPMSPWHLPTLSTSPGRMQASASAVSLARQSQSQAQSQGRSHGQSQAQLQQSQSLASLPRRPHTSAAQAHLPPEERAAAQADQRRRRVQEIKQTLRPLVRSGVSKVATRELFNDLFPCDYSST